MRLQDSAGFVPLAAVSPGLYLPQLDPALPDRMIQVERVTKCFGETRAVDDVSFQVRAGEVVGFLGPNGAGKSTLLKMLSTWLLPTSGTITVAGHDAVREPL